jgi:hypothetical protein
MKKLLLSLALVLMLSTLADASINTSYISYASGATSSNVVLSAVDGRRIAVLGVTAVSDTANTVLKLSIADTEGVTTNYTQAIYFDVGASTKQYYYPAGQAMIIAPVNTAVKLETTSTTKNSIAVSYDLVF